MICVNQTLEELDISDNMFNPKEQKLIVDALKYNWTLTDLRMDCMYFCRFNNNLIYFFFVF